MNEGSGIGKPADELEALGFQDEGIRKACGEDKETRLFSIVDAVGILTEQPGAS